MVDTGFREAYPFARRASQVRSAAAVRIGAIRPADREDIEQQAMVGLWQALPHYDPSRASLRTFVERVIHSKIVSATRTQRALRHNIPNGVAEPLDAEEPAAVIELRADVERVLGGLKKTDRRLAILLVDHTATEASRILGVSRSTVYQGIRRIRLAFTDVGFGPRGGPPR